jgi:phosphate transport system ATP-binding protein
MEVTTPAPPIPMVDQSVVTNEGAQLETRGVGAWFGDRQILDGMTLTMPPNTVTALIGPSGCGKSTFLRVLNRMHELVPRATLAGEVLLDGEDVYAATARPSEVRRHIGMVFQKPNPFPTMNIRENVLSGLKLAGIKKPGRTDDLVQRCLEQAGLWREVKDRLDSAGGSLSGGQQQRLCIARSLAVSPRVLLMDEPCSALDPTSTLRIEETIRDIVKDVTIVIVTHNMQQAARVSDYTAFFLGDEGRPGTVVEFGPTSELFTTPNDPRTEDYINGRFG